MYKVHTGEPEHDRYVHTVKVMVTVIKSLLSHAFVFLSASHFTVQLAGISVLFRDKIRPCIADE